MFTNLLNFDSWNKYHLIRVHDSLPIKITFSKDGAKMPIGRRMLRREDKQIRATEKLADTNFKG